MKVWCGTSPVHPLPKQAPLISPPKSPLPMPRSPTASTTNQDRRSPLLPASLSSVDSPQAPGFSVPTALFFTGWSGDRRHRPHGSFDLQHASPHASPCSCAYTMTPYVPHHVHFISTVQQKLDLDLTSLGIWGRVVDLLGRVVNLKQ